MNINIFPEGMFHKCLRMIVRGGDREYAGSLSLVFSRIPENMDQRKAVFAHILHRESFVQG